MHAGIEAILLPCSEILIRYGWNFGLRDENIPHVIIGGLAVSQAKILSRVCFASREGSLKAKLTAVLETPARSAMSLIVTRI